MDAPPTLATLPPEVQKEIAEALHYEDVLAFRQVSRDMRAASEDTFLITYFGERHFVFSRHGLSRLAEFTSYPQLTKKLWNVRIFVVDPRAFARSSKILSAQEPEEIDSDTEDVVASNRITSWGKEVRRLESVWDDEVEDLTSDDLDIHLLALTMRNLQAFSRDVDIGVTGSIGDDVAPGLAMGSNDAMEVMGLEGKQVHFRRSSFSGDCSRAIRSLFKAAARTGYSFNHLELCEDPDRGSFNQEALEGLCSYDISRLCHSWRGLSSLMMGFSKGQERWFVDRDHGLGKLIASAINITSLFLYNDGLADEDFEGPAAFDDFNPLGWLSEAFYSHRLKHLRLGGFCGRADQFAKVLHDHRQSLEVVELLGVFIQERECWSPVFQVVVNDLNLNSINLSGLMTMRDTQPIQEVVLPEGGRARNSLYLDEPEAIKESICQVLKEGLKYKIEGAQGLMEPE